MWYYERALMDGSWSPALSAAYPTGRSVEGILERIRPGSIKPVPDALNGNTLKQIRECLSQDGKFQAAYRDLRAAG